MERSSGANMLINSLYFDASKKYLDTNNNADADLDLTNGYMMHTGRLGWLSYKTRPDITFTTRYLQYVQVHLTKSNWATVKMVMRYLKCHPNFKIVLGLNHKDSPKIYIDAAHVDIPGIKLTKGYIFMYTGAPILWSSYR
jgi:hypothetical protein